MDENTIKPGVVYTVGAEPTISGGGPSATFAKGDRVRLKYGHSGKPDFEGDVRVVLADDANLDSWLHISHLTPESHGLKGGDRVTVSANAKTVAGGGVFFGGEVEAKVLGDGALNGDGDVLVRSTVTGMTQHVDPAYLTVVVGTPLEALSPTYCYRIVAEPTYCNGERFSVDVDPVPTVGDLVWPSEEYDGEPDQDGDVKVMSTRWGGRDYWVAISCLELAYPPKAEAPDEEADDVETVEVAALYEAAGLMGVDEGAVEAIRRVVKIAQRFARAS